MITDVYFVYNDEKQIAQIGGTYQLKVSPFFHFINEASKKCKKEAYALKSHYAARETPFALCTDKDVPIKAFYSEAGDVTKDLINYLNNE